MILPNTASPFPHFVVVMMALPAATRARGIRPMTQPSALRAGLCRPCRGVGVFYQVFNCTSAGKFTVVCFDESTSVVQITMETDSRPLLEDSSNGAISTEQAQPSAHLDEAGKIAQQTNSVDVQGTGLFHSPILASSSSSTVDVRPSSSKSKLAIDEPHQRSVIDTVSTNLDSFVLPVTKSGRSEENIPIDVQKHLETHIMSEQSDSGDVSAPKSPALAGAASLNPSDSPPCGSQPPQDGTPSEQASAGWTQDGVFVPMYSRKEKSLGLLCDKYGPTCFYTIHSSHFSFATVFFVFFQTSKKRGGACVWIRQPRNFM